MRLLETALTTRNCWRCRMERLTVDEMLECLGEYADHESAKQLIAMIEELKQYKAAEE